MDPDILAEVMKAIEAFTAMQGYANRYKDSHSVYDPLRQREMGAAGRAEVERIDRGSEKAHTDNLAWQHQKFIEWKAKKEKERFEGKDVGGGLRTIDLSDTPFTEEQYYKELFRDMVMKSPESFYKKTDAGWEELYPDRSNASRDWFEYYVSEKKFNERRVKEGFKPKPILEQKEWMKLAPESRPKAAVMSGDSNVLTAPDDEGYFEWRAYKKAAEKQGKIVPEGPQWLGEWREMSDEDRRRLYLPVVAPKPMGATSQPVSGGTGWNKQ